MTHNNPEKTVEIIARGLITSGEKLLLCKAKGHDWFYLPGGYVEFGETAQEALVREIKEELGIESEISDFLGTVENIFEQDGQKFHEINLVYGIKTESEHFESKEEHIEFSLIDKGKLNGTYMLPIKIKELILHSLKI